MLCQKDSGLCIKMFGMLVVVEPWGKDALRVRATRNAAFPPETGTLLAQSRQDGATVLIAGDGPESVDLTTGIGDVAGIKRKIAAKVVNGNISALVSAQDALHLHFVRNSDRKILFESESLAERHGKTPSPGRGSRGARSSRRTLQ
jgi:hypothetical protein